MKQKKLILVTGGAGYIGSQTCKFIRSKGFLPLSFDNLSNGSKKSVRWGKLIIGDLSNSKLLKKIILKYKPIAIFHFAALTSVQDSQKYPKKYFKNNVLGSKILIDIAGRLGVKSFIFSSSCAVYGNPSKNPVKISTDTKPINNYGKGKLVVERYLEESYKKHGMSSVSLRYFNASGADPELEIGDRNFYSSKLITRIILSLKNIKDLNIYGSNYPTKDGTCVRDFIHVKDLANAHFSAMNFLKKYQGVYKFNLGAGVGYSIMDMIKNFEKYSKQKIKYHFKNRRRGDIAILYSSKHFDKKFIWKPKRSQIKHIIHDSLRWYDKNHKYNKRISKSKM